MILKRAGVVPGHDLTSEAALTKLSYLLALPDLTVEDVIEKMAVPLCGELTRQSKMVFQHPGEERSDHLSNLSRAGYAIADGDLNQVRAIAEHEPRWFLNAADYSGNTPLVSFLMYART